MIIRKWACPLLALILLLSISAPVVVADDTPPGDTGGEIHPWDNTDRTRHRNNDDGDVATTSIRSPRILIGWFSFVGRGFVSIVLPASWIDDGQDQMSAQRSARRVVGPFRGREPSR